MSIYASIDVGSNTVRILIARKRDNGFESLYTNQKITRLGAGLTRTGNLMPEAIKRTINAIDQFKKEAVPFNPEMIWIVATSAVRNAKNRDFFITQVMLETDLELEVIPWQEEGRRMVLGVCYGLQEETRDFLVFDIGGGSTEFVNYRDGKITKSVGTELGVVRLTEKFLTNDSINDKDFKIMEKEIELRLIKVQSMFKLEKYIALVGTAGTVTTIAALDLDLFPYDPEKINGHKLNKNTIDDLLVKLKNMTIQERRELLPLEKGREDLIIPGLAIVKKIFEFFGFEEMLVSDYGLREGILLDRFNPNPGEPEITNKSQYSTLK